MKTDNAEIKTEKKEHRFANGLYEVVSIFSAAVIIIMILFTFIFRFVGVIGSSMVPTLKDGDWLVISQYKFDYEPSYGDIVVISQPNIFNENIVKRVIATEGETVDIDFITGRVIIDGVVLDETYINNATTTSGDVEFPLTVPEGYVFVMGDNRQASTDSRFSVIGLIKNEYILGSADYAFSAGKGLEKVSLNA